MRLGVIAESIIDRLVLKSNAAPEPLLETQMAFSIARSIMAVVKLGCLRLQAPAGDQRQTSPRSALRIRVLLRSS